MINPFQALSIRYKILLNFAMIVFILTLSTSIISFGLHYLQKQIDSLILEQRPIQKNIAEISSAIDLGVSRISLFLLSHEKNLQKEAFQYLTKPDKNIQILTQKYRHLLTQETFNQLALLSIELKKLHLIHKEITHLVKNTNNNYPAMHLASIELYPINLEMFTQISLLLSSELEEKRNNKQIKIKIIQDIYALRNTWNQGIISLRTFLGYRNHSVIKDANLYFEEFASKLKLITSTYQDHLTLEQEDALIQLSQQLHAYITVFKKVTQRHNSESWRLDAYIVKTKLTPTVKKITAILTKIRQQQLNAIDVAINNLMKTIYQANGIIIALMILGFIVIAILYKIMTKEIIQPIGKALDTGLTAISFVLDSYQHKTIHPTIHASSEDDINTIITQFISLSQALHNSAEDQQRYTANLQTKIDHILDAVKRSAQGDLTAVINTSGNDHIDELAVGTQQMIDKINHLVLDLQQTGDKVNTSVIDIATTAKQQEATVTEQAATSHEITRSALTISETTHELVSAMNQVANLTRQSTTAASNSHSVLKIMEQTMQEINRASNEITAKLAILNEKANNINGVITIINKVADQTNLLSLNASIEAEKAGEYGIGFSVVASEIRRLSDQTTEATWDIEQTVKEIQSAVASGVMEMDQFTEKMRRGITHTEEVGAQLNLIVNHVEALAPQFQAVHKGMQSQAENAEQISESINQLGEATQQTAESLRNSNRSIDRLSNLAQVLNKKVSFFHVKTDV